MFLVGFSVVFFLLIFGISDGSVLFRGMPVATGCVILIFFLQWLAFVPACLLKTEKFYDLMGALTFITVCLLSLVLVYRFDSRSFLLSTFLIIWASRLGWFLFSRMKISDGDSRFDAIKTNPSRFLLVWTMQGVWVTVCLSPVLATITGKSEVSLSFVDAPGIFLASVGFFIEVVADHQKRLHRDRYGAEMFICSGLWRYSRHPNYFGEIIFWLGIVLTALPAMSGFSYISAIVPIFVYLLLTRVSGTRLLEKAADIKWGDDPLYQKYVAETPLLWPKIK